MGDIEKLLFLRGPHRVLLSFTLRSWGLSPLQSQSSEGCPCLAVFPRDELHGYHPCLNQFTLRAPELHHLSLAPASSPRQKAIPDPKCAHPHGVSKVEKEEGKWGFSQPCVPSSQGWPPLVSPKGSGFFEEGAEKIWENNLP